MPDLYAQYFNWVSSFLAIFMARVTTILDSSPFDHRPDDPFVLNHIEQLIDNSVSFVFFFFKR
jgi:hypothetical protein